LASLDLAEERGVLSVSPTRVAFRHELTRRAVADLLPAVRRLAGHQAVLRALLARHVDRGVDLSRILHHAAEVGEESVIVHYGPLALAEAVAAGSHREAVAHGRLVLRHRAAFEPAVLAQTLERHAIECYATGLDDAVTPMAEAVQLRRTMGDPVALGVDLRWLSRFSWWVGDRERAYACAAEAIEVLTGAGDEPALALALSNQSQLYALAGRREEAIAVGRRAVAMARDLADPALLSHALNNVGMATWDQGDERGRALLEESLRLARDAGEVEHACRAAVNIAWHLINGLRLDEALALLDETIGFAEESELDGFLRQLTMTRAMAQLRRSAWDDAERDAAGSLDSALINRCPALAVAGLVRARRGDESGHELARKAFALAERLGEATRLGPAGAALLEAAWLNGRIEEAAQRVLPWYDELHRHGYRAMAAEIGFWLRVAGHEVPIAAIDHPYAHLAAGRWREAAASWEQAGCAYEHALALSFADSATDILPALSILDGLGAAPLAARVRAKLRDLGVSRVPRGPTPSTRDNPAGLTDRQVQVLGLLARGLTNAEIAARLVVSVRTVDSHVAAVLDKLEAGSRREAVDRAEALGLAPAGRR
jgi:DNA-binding CsgD family transcriptional regulator/tetratricopeptide (TPR) repeat protein